MTSKHLLPTSMIMGKQSSFARGATAKIDSDTIEIKNGSLLARNISFQINNISALAIEGHGYRPAADAIAVIAMLFCTVLAIATKDDVRGLFGFLAVLCLVPPFIAKCSLAIVTNAGAVFIIEDKNRQFLLDLKGALEEAMHNQPEAAAFSIDRRKLLVKRHSPPQPELSRPQLCLGAGE